MNRLRSQKFKLSTNTNTVDPDAGTSPTSPTSNNNGLFTKLTKRYSNLSNKIIRRQHPSGRNGHSPQKTISGSYDMTGANSEDHRLEIGAPVLISTTTLDADRFGITEERLRQIGGGIAISGKAQIITAVVTNSNSLPKVVEINIPQVPPSPQIASSSSETELFVDALSGTPRSDDNSEELEDKYVLALPTPIVELKSISSELNLSTSSESQPTTDKESSPDIQIQHTSLQEPPHKHLRSKAKLLKNQHSKSAQNLHRTELKVFLQKAPSMSLDMRLTTADFRDCHDLPHLAHLPNLPEIYGLSDSNNDANDADKENSSPSDTEIVDRIDGNLILSSSPKIAMTALQSKSEPNTPVCAETNTNGYLNHQEHFKSIDSLEIHHRNGTRYNRIFNSSTSINQGSKNSLISHNSTIDDFNLKSVSFESLNAQSLFVSIDELNEITRQINESEDFNQEIDLEYCTHRDNLKPSERRITLLKNKNSKLINFTNNKEKLKKSWNGMKHWIGEESSKLKEVVHQKQSMIHKLGASRLQINTPTEQGTTSGKLNDVEGDNLKQRQSREKSEGRTVSNSISTIDINHEHEIKLHQSSDTLDNVNDVDLEDSLTRVIEDSSPSKLSKREGQNGFEELRRYIKQGGDFGKELILILQERVESEMLYSKSLSKMANKLNKACRELPGSIAEAWRGVATEMEDRSDIHRQLSVSLTDEIVKPLKTVIDSQHKTRKSVENNVDKASRVLAEWRVSEAKAKKSSHTAARENEKLQDAMLDVRIQKSPSIALLHQGPNKVAAEKEIKSAEKDCAKLDNKRKKAEDAVKRADVEYYTLCVRAERARVDWEMAVLRGSSLLQNIENHRLLNMKNFVTNYSRLTANMNPIIDTLVQRLQPQVDACNLMKDMQIVKNIRRNSEGPSEQLLPDFYCEHTTLAMNRERRKHSLIKLLQLVKTDLERERRSRNGLKGLSQSLNNQEHQNITDKLYHIRSMLTYLEGARFKLQSALLELDHKPRTSHPLAQHIQITRDRHGLQQSVLKVPLWLKNNENTNPFNISEEPMIVHDSSGEYDCMSQANTSNSTNISCSDISKDSQTTASITKFNRSKSNIETFRSNTQLSQLSDGQKLKTISVSNHHDPYSDRGQADGGSNQQDSDFDEFSSQDEDDESQLKHHHHHNIQTNIENSAAVTTIVNSIGQCENYYENTSSSQMENTPINGISKPVILSRCKALYSYTPKLYDELELSPGDVIEVHAKQDDGWWLGALHNQIGIFPATYVEEFV